MTLAKAQEKLRELLEVPPHFRHGNPDWAADYKKLCDIEAVFLAQRDADKGRGGV